MPETEATVSRTLGVAIPAAGSGVRMGGVRKPLLEIRGEPILIHAIRPFLQHPGVEAVAVALGDAEFSDPPPWLQDLDPRLRLVQGGASRGESVWAALQALPEDVDLIAVHDAARPLVTLGIIDRCVEEVGPGRGAVAGWPAVDTLKRVDEGRRIQSTVPREQVWHAQTPQVFPRDLIVDAYREALRFGITDTDDAALVERMGGEVVMAMGSPSNMKVTMPEDLDWIEFLLSRGLE